MKTPTNKARLTIESEPPKRKGMSLYGKLVLGIGVILLLVCGLGFIAWLSEPQQPKEFTYDVVEDTLEQKQEQKQISFTNQTIEQQLAAVLESDNPFLALIAFLFENFWILLLGLVSVAIMMNFIDKLGL